MDDATPQDLPPVLTAGYGTGPADAMVDWLRAHDVGYLLDVRTTPYSKHQPDYDREPLAARVGAAGVQYAFFGDMLGGRPDDPTCYTDGHVDYQAVRARSFHQRGIDRIRAAWEAGHRVALLCACSRSERCHRARLVGVSLDRAGVPVAHRDPDGRVVSHDVVMARLGSGPDLFGELPEAARSVHRYAHLPTRQCSR